MNLEDGESLCGRPLLTVDQVVRHHDPLVASGEDALGDLPPAIGANMKRAVAWESF